MTVAEMTRRINELYHKSKEVGLTEAEKEEQQRLRQAYVANVRANLRGQLDNISIVEKDGSVTDLGKSAARKRALAKRESISAQDRAAYDAAIAENVTAMREYREAGMILAYAGYRSEVDTKGLIESALRDGKTVFAPRVSGEDMEFWRIASLADLREGYRGIPEPEQTVSFPEWIGQKSDDRNETGVMMWMPGAAFDRERHRIGYGGGFYDRYLARCAGEDKDGGTGAEASGEGRRFRLCIVALAYSCQVSDKIPFEAHDIRPDRIVTEQGIIC